MSESISEMPVRVVRSPRRRKTISAVLKNGEIVIRIPSRMTKWEEQEWVDKMKKRMEKRTGKAPTSDKDLLKRARELNKKFFENLLQINSIRFTDNQHKRHGSCSTLSRDIRISRKLTTMPTWVLDYIIMHELTHLKYPDHSKQFWETVNKYKYTERARGYLIAKDLESQQ